ncbi:MAG: cytochrome c oxidase subunit 3 [Chitinophagaceae bacterium]|nr:cytochrome c oxidase subunit 3 [Chitinophagaceae bacterium]
MMFAGLTSAYIVKMAQPEWTTLQVPKVFYYSTGVMLISSLTVQMALKAFKERSMRQYRTLITLTAILGCVFIALQFIGFKQIWNAGIDFRGSGGAQFLYIIFGLHGLHVLGGVIALLVMFFKAFSSRVRNYNPVSVELISTYWHFVDLLWIYLFVFFLYTL